jgi:hypothetical protein
MDEPMTTSASPKFDAEWKALKAGRGSGSFEYLEPSDGFCAAVDNHFRRRQSTARFGVYVVRRRQTGEVVYIGKGGTVQRDGTFKRQDVPLRLKAVRRTRVPSNVWFRSLCSDCGPLRIEYVFVGPTPVSPALAEARLLQAFLNEKGQLPRYNEAL